MKNTKEKILVVDDEKRMCDSLKILLSDLGYDVTALQEGGKAIEKIRSTKGGFDAVISDIKMPDFDGIEVLKAARQKDKDALVILLTGYGSLESAIKAVNQGAFDYLLKPVDFSQLQLSIKRGLEKRKAQITKNKLLLELKRKNELLKKKVEQLDALYQAGKSLSTTGELNQLLDKIIKLATKVIGVKAGSIMLLDESGKVLTISAAIGLEKEVIEKTKLELGKSIAGWVAEQGDSLMVSDVEKDLRFKRINKEKYETHSLLSVPLKVKDKVLGVINLNNKTSGKIFNQDDLRLLVTFASQAAVAIDDAYNFEKSKKKIKELSTLYQIASTLSQLSDFEEIAQFIFEKLKKIMKIDFCFWFDLNEKENKLCLVFSQTKEKGVLKKSTEMEIPLEQNEIFQISKLNAKIKSKLSQTLSLKSSEFSFTSVPISAERTLHGIFCVGNFENQPFTKDDEALVSIVASQAKSLYERQKSILNATRLVTMGKMISEISHDLRKPLTNIKGTLQVLREKVFIPLEEQKFFDSAEEEVYRLTQLVKEMVDFSNPNKYQLEKTSIIPIMERTLNLVKEDLAKNNISLVKNYQQNLPSLLINENEMMEVFLNIILNAIEAMPDGGKLQIDINKFYDPQREDNFVQIGITDEGVGIPAENLDRIFDRYFTTKPNGTGLGLAIVDRVIQAHDGFVEVRSEEGKGTTFLVNLPSHNL